MIRLVLDTNIVLSGLFWDGPPRTLLAPNPPGFVRYTSAPLIEELEDVLARRKFAARIALSPATLPQLVEKYLQSATVVIPHCVAGIAPDPDDDVVIGTALAANADFIVTGDRAFLSLIQPEGVRIVPVTQALEIVVSS